ncbi:TIGR03915 family putative DNA repair protein [Flavobacterium selenitireducens]|uniref:TIGR03915 family putative DNA repair protein n=1 Tax=Flavobacterium selenitireducens TaxID=2722704 RepID=UPI00168B0265|nr:TIGR03915 family putative DNA repair protein [Flavobacterium selenitireducens]MBD3582219.1 DNA metabolism protein [Flavobacterium selenitireducens]
MITYVFDGSFEGLLTAIFDSYELKSIHVSVICEKRHQPGLIGDDHIVTTDEIKARRVWQGLKKKLPPDWQQRFYNTYLSELPESFQHLFDFAHYIFDNPKGAETNFGNASVMAVSQTDKSVNRERHRMKAFIRFQKTSDGIFYAPIEPDYNVLPLIATFFKNRYADQMWIIYDLKRKYGLFYNLEKVEEIKIDFVSETESSTSFLPAKAVDENEELYGLLWNDYFRSTNIPARRNMKLHLQHVPRRYWRYLTEKQHN